MKVHVYRIDCLTNLHVGSGEASYCIVDNQVQKDAVLGAPTIHSSGIKGALREHFEALWGRDHPDITYIFGSDTNRSKNEQPKPGAYKFLSACLIARPLRVSEGTVSYANVTTVELVNHFLNLLRDLGVQSLYGQAISPLLLGVEDNVFLTNNPQAIRRIEGYDAKPLVNPAAKALLDQLIGGNYAVVKSLQPFDLPILVRNQLENGKSNNLWYEEVVPHQSVFHTIVLTPDGESVKLSFTPGVPVQFGGNASIGYGFTRVTEVLLA